MQNRTLHSASDDSTSSHAMALPAQEPATRLVREGLLLSHSYSESERICFSKRLLGFILQVQDSGQLELLTEEAP